MRYRMPRVAATGVVVCIGAASFLDSGDTCSLLQNKFNVYADKASVAEQTVDRFVKDVAIRDMRIEAELQGIREQKKKEQDSAESKERKLKEIRKKQRKALDSNGYYKKYKQKKKANADTVGWLSISNTSIDYPVMYAENDFYLNHNSDKEEDSNGAIYLSGNQGNWGKVNLVNGHNMKSGKMFGPLDKFKDEDYCTAHRDVVLARKGEVGLYRVFSVFLADARNEPVSFSEEKEGQKYQDFLRTLSNRSLFNLDYDAEADDFIILNTCSYEYSEAHLLVCAYKLSE